VTVFDLNQNPASDTSEFGLGHGHFYGDGNGNQKAQYDSDVA
jgi:hypothetical protein